MHRSNRKNLGGGGVGVGSGSGSVARRRTVGLLSSSTNTSGSSSQVSGAVAAAAAAGGVHLRADNLKDFKERVDSTIQQLSGLVSLLSSREVDGGGQPRNSSNRGDASDGKGACCCHCHAAADGTGGCLQAAASPQPQPPPPVPQPASSTAATPAPAARSSVSTTTRRGGHARSSQDFSIAPPPLPSPKPQLQPPSSSAGGFVGANGGRFHAGDTSDVAVDEAAAAAAATATATRRKSTTIGGSSAKQPLRRQHQPSQHQHQQQQQQHQHQPCHQHQQQQPVVASQPEPPAGSGADNIRFLWYDANRKRYSARSAELICAKTVRRLHLSVHYFRVAGEDLLLLEKDCSEDGLAFLDVDSVVAFEGLSVEKVLKLQQLGCQLRPEDLSREFAVEKGRSKYYVVPVEDAGGSGGDWRLCEGAGAQKLDSLKRMLEQQEMRRGGAAGGGGGGGGVVSTAPAGKK